MQSTAARTDAAAVALFRTSPSFPITPNRSAYRRVPGLAERAGIRGLDSACRAPYVRAPLPTRRLLVAQHKSAKKRARQNLKRRARNRGMRSALRTATKAVRTALEQGEADQAAARLRVAERQIRKAATRGALSKKQASRSISRLAKAVHRTAHP